MAPSRHQRTQRARDTLELWDPRGSAGAADWRRLDLVSERRLGQRGALNVALDAVNRRLSPTATPHTAPRQVRWLALAAADSGWAWGLVIDDRLVLPTRAAPGWVEGGAAAPQPERAGRWWSVHSPTERWWWYVGAESIESAVRRALHAAAPIDTTVAIARSQIRHDRLVAIVDASPPGRPALRLAVQDLGGPHGPGARGGCLLARDLDHAENLCA